ncbi:DUF29 domain-containing protein [Duganella sp. HH105]|uniref:DUF29 domain-containing protein n=1 Tax=Duganella sp. HH105 TaxID=1781067 RepID=UPI000877CE08|nr:DUF29 domain-containing protein [Duganella sp. HH105]OEZ62991.1 hypothetical protein DUGA6_07840 [Duganella sp. HH105]
MTATYEDDVAAWALEQVALLRTGQWALLDIEHIAEEIEDMNISHRHQLAHRMAILMAHLLKWKYQPDRRGRSWKNTIRNQRDKIDRLLTRMPSLRRLLEDPEWNQDVWDDAVDLAGREANLSGLPEVRIWGFGQVLSADYLPS